MPTFCRHGRFQERCPICSRDLPHSKPAGARPPRAKRPPSRSGPGTGARRRVRGEPIRVRHEGRSADDGFRSPLVPGVRASADGRGLAEEISFSSARLLALEAEPPGLYGEARALLAGEGGRAAWICFLIAYLSPLQDGDDPFAGIRMVLEAAPDADSPAVADLDLDSVPLGPGTSHVQRRGAETLLAYGRWLTRSGDSPSGAGGDAPGGGHAAALTGDPAWTPERRFERLFERLALPGFGRMGRYELLVTMGRLGICELSADSLHLGGGGSAADDPTVLAAKRVFGIGDPLLLDRRAAALAQAVSIPIETLDLALANWAAPERATRGFPGDIRDDGALERAVAALGA